MVSKYLIFNTFKEFYDGLACFCIYILSILVLPIGFLVNIKIAHAIVIFSFALFGVFIAINFIKEAKNNYKFGFIKSLWKKEGLSLFFIYGITNIIWDISRYIYYDFLLTDVHFSLIIFSYIVLSHILFFVAWILAFILYKPKDKTISIK